MAKRKKEQSLGFNIKRDKAVRKATRMYWVLGIIIVLSTVFNMVVQNVVYIKTVQELGKTINIVQAIMGLQQSFNDVNENILLLISTRGTAEGEQNTDELVALIDENFKDVEEYRKRYNELNADSSETVRNRFTFVESEFEKYKRKVDEVKERLGTLGHEEGLAIYKQELEPSQLASSQMLQSVIEIGERESLQNAGIAEKIRNTAQLILIGILVATVILIIIISRSQIKLIIDIRQKEQELTEAGNRLTKSRKKLIDSAMTNILTGMKNRYAMNESLNQLIGNAQFNIAVFDVDNFRMFNDMYGYELGDEYLAMIAERLKGEYSEYAEMFNITGNEFCMIFYEHVSDLQAQQLAEQIRQGMGQPIMVAGIAIQATVSSSLYHYLPSDNLDVNTLLMKMDSALHAAKRDGGNRLYQIQ